MIGKVHITSTGPALFDPTLPGAWQSVWRRGVAPLLSTQSLEALRKGLVEDDPRLVQGATTSPPPLQCVQDWDCEAACALGYAGWQGDGLETVAEVEEFFARMCFEIDQAMGEPAACSWFLNWFDDTPREEMRRELLAEVERELAIRLAAEDHEVHSETNPGMLERMYIASDTIGG